MRTIKNAEGSVPEMKCKICLSLSEKFAEATLMKRYRVAYFRCGSCGFVQTEEPYWLEEAYSEAIKRSDVGHIRRNLRLAKITRAIIMSFFDGSKRFLDFGSGYGVLVRIMRDAGYDFYGYDKHCASLFALDFEAPPDVKNGYELVTAYEVFEHLADPLQELREMLSFSSTVLFTTELLPAHAPKPGEWGYYGVEHGQHISFYTLKSLETLAERFSLNLYSDGRMRHLLTPKKLSPTVYRIVSLYKVAALLSPLSGRPSLTAADGELIVGKELK